MLEQERLKLDFDVIYIYCLFEVMKSECVEWVFNKAQKDDERRRTSMKSLVAFDFLC